MCLSAVKPLLLGCAKYKMELDQPLGREIEFQFLDHCLESGLEFTDAGHMWCCEELNTTGTLQFFDAAL